MAYLLILFSLSKLCIACSFEKNKFEKSIFFSIKEDSPSFRSKAITILVIDGIVGLFSGLLLLS